MTMSTTRRRFLRGAGGAMLALPWLEATHARAQGMSAVPRRLIMVSYPMGFVRDEWRPTATGSSFTFPFITAPLEPFKARTLIISNVDNKVVSLNAQHHFGHPGKKESVLTGTLMRAAFSGDRSNTLANVIADQAGSDVGGPNNESICSLVGRAIRGSRPFSSIDVGVSGEANELSEVRSDFCFEAATTPVGVQCNPARAFARAFANVDMSGGAQEAERRRLFRKKSALDLVRDSFRELRTGLNTADQRRLDEHAARVRQIEIDIVRASCTAPMGNYGTPSPTASYQPFRQLSMRERGALMIPLLAHAMACDLAPVGRLEFFDQQNPYFGLPAVDAARSAWRAAATPNDWHGMVHGDASPVDGVRTRGAPPASFLLEGYRFFVQQLADLLGALAALPEGPDGQTALDHSLVVLSSDFGNGDGHSSRKLGFVLAGQLNGARTGYHFDGAGRNADFYTESAYSSTQVLNTIARIFDVRDGAGAPLTSFGLEGYAPGVGTLPVF
jgi:hypothetical protein